MLVDSTPCHCFKLRKSLFVCSFKGTTEVEQGTLWNSEEGRGGEQYSYTKRDQFIFPGQFSTLNSDGEQCPIHPTRRKGGELESEYGSGTRFFIFFVGKKLSLFHFLLKTNALFFTPYS